MKNSFCWIHATVSEVIQREDTLVQSQLSWLTPPVPLRSARMGR